MARMADCSNFIFNSHWSDWSALKMPGPSDGRINYRNYAAIVRHGHFMSSLAFQKNHHALAADCYIIVSCFLPRSCSWTASGLFKTGKQWPTDRHLHEEGSYLWISVLCTRVSGTKFERTAVCKLGRMHDSPTSRVKILSKKKKWRSQFTKIQKSSRAELWGILFSIDLPAEFSNFDVLRVPLFFYWRHLNTWCSYRWMIVHAPYYSPRIFWTVEIDISL